MINSAPPFILFLQETNFYYSATSTPEWEGTTTCGKISSAKKAWETATKTDSFCSASAPNMHSPSRTRCSACQIVSTWRHPRSKHWHLLDYAIIRQPDRKDVLVTRTKPSADDCWTDHRLLITRLGISIRSKPKVNHHLPSRKKFDVSKLHDPTIHDEYEKTIHEKLITNPIDPLSVEKEWKTIRDTISESAKAILGFTKRKNQDWFDENDQEIS